MLVSLLFCEEFGLRKMIGILKRWSGCVMGSNASCGRQSLGLCN